jgi:hypothetical protein
MCEAGEPRMKLLWVTLSTGKVRPRSLSLNAYRLADFHHHIRMRIYHLGDEFACTLIHSPKVAMRPVIDDKRFSKRRWEYLNMRSVLSVSTL